jgi:hypothetical protein
MSKLPKGLDQQGRHPEAAEAATEVGVEDLPEAVGSVVLLAVVVIVVIAVVALLAGYYS